MDRAAICHPRKSFQKAKRTMSKPWLKTYGTDIPEFINPKAFPSVTAMFEQAFETYKDQTAFVSLGTSRTYGEIDEVSRAFAAFLQNDLGVKKGDRIAVMVPNILAFPIAFTGIIRCGAIQVNVNPMYTPHELQHQLNDSGAETIVIFSGSSPTLAEIVEKTQIKNIITVNLGDGGDREIPSPPVDPRLSGVIRFSDALESGKGKTYTAPEITLDDTLFLQYTGGTTGLSKGAVLSHGNLVANTEQFKAMMPRALRPGKEVVVTALPLYHVFALMVNLISYFSIGAKNYLIANPRDPEELIGTYRDSGFSVSTGVNTLMAGLVAHPEFAKIDFSNFRLMMGGGAPVLPVTSERWKQVTGEHIREGYGLSETSPILCVNPMTVEGFSATVGLPVPSTEIKLLDDLDNEVAMGEAGEICARGPQVMSGYWNRADANDKEFTSDGFFRTGDIGVFDEAGFLKIVDRKKDVVLVSGFNVYPNEIEAHVTELEGVLECAAVGVPSEKTGEAVRLFIVQAPGANLTVGDVIAHCRKELTGYKVPHQVRFIDELPKSTVGKILRRELRDV